MTNLFEEFPEWVGMPEFVQEKKEPFKTVVVRFETEENFKEFQTLIAQQMTLQTKSIWHPYKSHWGRENMVYKDAA